MLSKLSGIDKFVADKIQIDKVPDSMAKPMHDFAVAFPSHPKSEHYLYAATLLSEKSGRYFETAKWCEEYAKLFPKGKFFKDAVVAAGHNFEKSAVFDKAIEFYDKAFKEFPNTKIGEDSKRIADMLRKGLITEEQQLEYLIQQMDSSKKVQ